MIIIRGKNSQYISTSMTVCKSEFCLSFLILQLHIVLLWDTTKKYLICVIILYKYNTVITMPLQEININFKILDSKWWLWFFSPKVGLKAVGTGMCLSQSPVFSVRMAGFCRNSAVSKNVLVASSSMRMEIYVCVSVILRIFWQMTGIVFLEWKIVFVFFLFFSYFYMSIFFYLIQFVFI